MDDTNSALPVTEKPEPTPRLTPTPPCNAPLETGRRCVASEGHEGPHRTATGKAYETTLPSTALCGSPMQSGPCDREAGHKGLHHHMLPPVSAGDRPGTMTSPQMNGIGPTDCARCKSHGEPCEYHEPEFRAAEARAALRTEFAIHKQDDTPMKSGSIVKDEIPTCPSIIPGYRLPIGWSEDTPSCFKQKGHAGPHRADGGWMWEEYETKRERTRLEGLDPLETLSGAQRVISDARATVDSIKGQLERVLQGRENDLQEKERLLGIIERQAGALKTYNQEMTRLQERVTDDYIKITKLETELAEANQRIEAGERAEAADHSICLRNDEIALRENQRAVTLRAAIETVIKERDFQVLHDALRHDEENSSLLPSQPYGEALRAALTTLNDTAETLDDVLADPKAPEGWIQDEITRARDGIRDFLQAMVTPEEIPNDPQPEIVGLGELVVIRHAITSLCDRLGIDPTA
jgi:hypothetical protein